MKFVINYIWKSRGDQRNSVKCEITKLNCCVIRDTKYGSTRELTR